MRELIEKKLSQNIPDELSFLFESSTFVSYFDSPQFIDIVNAYLQHKLICDYTKESANLQRRLQKGGIINANYVINYISDGILERYHNNKVITIPSEAKIKAGLAHILSIAEEVIASNLSEDNSQLLFLLNSRADIYQDQIISILENLKKTISQIKEKALSFSQEDFEQTKEKYHAKLKDKNSDAHIYLLDKFPFEQFYVPPILQNAPDGVIHTDMYAYGGNYRSSWKEIFSSSNIVYVTGGAGYGKSLFVKKIINNYTDLNIFRSNEYLVISGELKSFYSNTSGSAISVVDFLKESIKSNTLMDVSKEFIEYYLNAGRCLILLDALDEVEKSKRLSLHESIIAFFKNENPNNKICITSRDRGFIPERNVEVFKICPLNQEQIEKYVDKIIALGKFEKSDKEPFMKQTAILVEKGFLNSFLVLSLLINIYKAELKLPENKLELYQKCFEYIANKREKGKTEKEFDWKMISPIMKDNTFIELSRLCMPNNTNIDKEIIKNCLLDSYRVKYASEADTENAIDEFLKFCSDRTELFVPSTEDKFKFFHRSFFEYFYSLYIFLRCSTSQERLSELLKFDVDSEVFELTTAMLKQKSEREYQSLIELLFEETASEFESDSIDFPVFNILILCMQVVDDIAYKLKFINILTQQRDNILKNIDSIHNLRLITTIFESDYEAYLKIYEAYKNNCILNSLERCDMIFTAAEKYTKEYDEDFFKYAFKDPRSNRFRRRFSYRFYDVDKNFYMPIFAQICDCKKILLSITTEDVLTLYKDLSYRNYKRKTSQMMNVIEKFRQLDDEIQEDIVKYILYSSFVIG